MLPLMEEFKQVRIFRAEEFQTLLYLHHIIDNLCGSGKGHFSKVNNSPQYFVLVSVKESSEFCPSLPNFLTFIPLFIIFFDVKTS